jgi:hypothetical protein
LHAFIFKADRRALIAMLDQAFGEAGVSCRALLPLVFVTTINAQQIRSTVRPQDGYMSERELGFWVPVLVSSPGGSQIAFYIPYLFVDNPAALSAGRDIYGFNKIFGQFDVSAAEETTPAEVRAQVLPTFAPDTQVNWKPVTRFMGKLSPDQQRWSAAESTFADVVSAMFEHLDAQDATIARSGISTFARQIPLLFLKQFRDAGDGADACYRRVICANAVLDGKFEAGWLSHGGLRLELGEYASMNLCESLGLVQSLSPQIAFWARLSAMVGRGHEFDSNGNSQRERA